MSIEWLEQERRQGRLKAELRRLKRKTKAHPYLLVVATLAAAITIVTYYETKKQPFKAYVVIRVTEGDIIREADPLAGSKMDEYLRSVALSNTQLQVILNKHKLFPLAQAKGPQHGIEELRDAMRISIVNNYFAGGYYLSTSARSARVTLRFEHKDPGTAYAVVRDLADAMVANEQRRRQLKANELLTIANKSWTIATEQYTSVREAMATTEVRIVAAQNAKAREQVSKLEIKLRSLEARSQQLAVALERLNRNRQTMNLASAVNQAELGLRFDVVDERAPLPHDTSSPILLAALSLGLFCLILPMSAIAIGAFDTRLSHREDVERFGYTYLGNLSLKKNSNTRIEPS